MATAATRTLDVHWIPFKIDCEELLGRFQKTDSVRYEQFAALWRALDFSSVFRSEVQSAFRFILKAFSGVKYQGSVQDTRVLPHSPWQTSGMTTNYEKRPFSRLIFTTVYDYFLPPYSFQIRVGALYMFYGLYITQPARPKEKIWIALKDWMFIQKFVSDAASCQHLDVVYVYRKLVAEKAFLYTAMPNQLTFDAKRRFKNKHINDTFQDWPVKVTELVNAGTLEEITSVQAYYERIKQALHVSASVSVTPINLTAQLQECALEFQKWHENYKKKKTKKAKDRTPPSECSKRADELATIKAKSYRHLTRAPTSRRHRQVEMDTSGSGTERMQEVVCPGKKKQLSLRERTWRNLGIKEEQQQHHWLLSLKDEDKTALKRGQQKNSFKW